MGIVSKNKRNVKSKKTAKKKSSRYFEIPDLSNDPYILKKNEAAKAMLRKAGILSKD